MTRSTIKINRRQNLLRHTSIPLLPQRESRTEARTLVSHSPGTHDDLDKVAVRAAVRVVVGVWTGDELEGTDCGAVVGEVHVQESGACVVVAPDLEAGLCGGEEGEEEEEGGGEVEMHLGWC